MSALCIAVSIKTVFQRTSHCVCHAVNKQDTQVLHVTQVLYLPYTSLVNNDTSHLIGSVICTLREQKIHVSPRQVCPSSSLKLLRKTSVCHST